jgi:hypothetical protein
MPDTLSPGTEDDSEQRLSRSDVSNSSNLSPTRTVSIAQHSAEPSEEEETEPVIPVSAAHLASCSFTSWFPLFRRHSIASRILPLPDAFIQYLLEDGVCLPDALHPARVEGEGSDSDWSDAEEEEETGAENDTNSASAESATFFPALLSFIETAIAELGGSVFPRMDRSSPSDAAWISADKTLRCSSAADVLLLLKASDAIAASLSSSPPVSSPHHLILRRWSNLYPSSLFRCFLHHHSLLAISQRDSTHYPHLSLLSHRARTVQSIRRWTQQTVLPVWTAEDGRGVLDVYVDADGRVWLVDVKLWATQTDPALFTWSELVSLADDRKRELEEEETEAVSDADAADDGDGAEVEYRVVESGGDNRYMLNVARKTVRRLPAMDGIDLSDSGSIDRFVSSMRQQQLHMQ